MRPSTCAALVDDVLVVPRLEVDRLLIEPVDFPLRPAAFRIAGLVFPPGGAKSASVSVSGSAVVHADPNRVEQVLRNLLENAAKLRGHRGDVEAAARDDEWLVTVIDDGSGVDAEHRERIFAPFEQAVRLRQSRQRPGPGAHREPGARRGHGRAHLVRARVPHRGPLLLHPAGRLLPAGRPGAGHPVPAVQ